MGTEARPPGVGISGAARKECFLCDLLVWGLGKGHRHSLLCRGCPPTVTTMVAVSWKPRAAMASES